MGPAHVYLTTSAIPMKAVDQNVSLTLIVHRIKAVYRISAETLAPALVAKTLIAQLLTIYPLVHVDQDSLETHSVTVPL